MNDLPNQPAIARVSLAFVMMLAIGCIGPPPPLPPEVALAHTSQRINRMLDEVDFTGAVQPDRPISPTTGPLEFWRHAHPVLDQALGGPQPAHPLQDALEPHPIRMQFIGEWHFAVQKLTLSLAAGDLPDVATVNRNWVAPLARSGRLLPLDEVVSSAFLADLQPAAREAFSIDGRLYALPLDGFCSVLLYNTTMLDSVPEDWEGLRSAAQVMRENRPESSFHPIGHLPYIELLWSAGGRVIFGGRSGLERPEALDALQFLLNLRDEGLMHPRAMTDSQWGLSLFLRGQVAMTVIPSRDWPAVGDDTPAAMAPIPGRDRPISRLQSDAVIVFAEGGEKTHAIAQLLDFLSGPGVQGAQAASRGSVPIRSSVADTVEIPSGLEAAFQHSRSEPLLQDWGTIETELERGLDRAFRWRDAVDD